MQEIKVVLETNDKKESGGIFNLFWGTILIPIAGLIAAFMMKGQEVDAKNFELAIKILESQKKSDPEIKKWAKDTFYKYAKIKPSQKALDSLNNKPFIYDDLKIEVGDIGISLMPNTDNKFELTGTNSLGSSIVFNGIEFVDSAMKTCYVHPVGNGTFTSGTSFIIDNIDMKPLYACFTNKQDNDDKGLLDIVPVSNNSIDSIKEKADSVEKITLHLSWSTSDSFQNLLSNELKEPSNNMIHKSYYLIKKTK